MIVFCHQGDESVGRVVADVGALQATGDEVQLAVFQQLANHHLGFMTGQLAVEQLLAVFVHQRAVLGDKRDLLANFREKRDQLIVLVAAGDNKFNTLLLKLRELREKTRAIVLLGVIEKSSVHIGDDNFNGHNKCSWLTSTSNILITM